MSNSVDPDEAARLVWRVERFTCNHLDKNSLPSPTMIRRPPFRIWNRVLYLIVGIKLVKGTFVTRVLIYRIKDNWSPHISY